MNLIEIYKILDNKQKDYNRNNYQIKDGLSI